MSKGLQALNYIYQHWNCNHPTHCSGIEKHFNTIEKELKALEIIKEKKVNIFTFYECCSWHNPSNYNDSIGCPINYELTQEEYDLLKEVLL